MLWLGLFLLLIFSEDTPDLLQHIDTQAGLEKRELSEEQCSDSSGLENLFNAAATGDFKLVQQLTSEHQENINMDVMKGQTVTFAACIHGSLEIVSYLVDMGARLNVQDESGFDCLYVASVRGHAKLFKYLLSKGQDPLKMYTKGMTAFHGACGQASPGQLKILEMLRRSGVDLDEPKQHEETCLMLAVAARNIKAVKWLLKKGVNPNEANVDKRSPLQYAFHGAELVNGNQDLSEEQRAAQMEEYRTIIYTLIRNEASVWHIDNYKQSVLNHDLWKKFIDVTPQESENAQQYNKRVLQWMRKNMPKKKKQKKRKKKSTKKQEEVHSGLKTEL